MLLWVRQARGDPLAIAPVDHALSGAHADQRSTIHHCFQHLEHHADVIDPVLFPGATGTTPLSLSLQPPNRGNTQQYMVSPPHWGVGCGRGFYHYTRDDLQVKMTISSPDIARWTHGRTMTVALASPGSVHPHMGCKQVLLGISAVKYGFPWMKLTYHHQLDMGGGQPGIMETATETGIKDRQPTVIPQAVPQEAGCHPCGRCPTSTTSGSGRI